MVLHTISKTWRFCLGIN